MAHTTAYQYTLQPYSGPKSRHACPACGKARCFTRYLNTDTGEVLPDEFGRCDRETNCGYHVSPYHKGQLSAGYPKQEPPATLADLACRPIHAALPIALTIPLDVVDATLNPSHYRHNALAHLLRQQLGLGVADELLRRFKLGTSSHWPGACIFWLIDEQGRTRGGQVVLYDETGHTVKKPRRHTTWAHTALAQVHEQRNEAMPHWLAEYAEHGQKSPCLFGLPQLDGASTWQPIALVESAKTAIVATPYMPQYTWLATMGLSYLTAERLEPIKSRRIVLFPDAGCLDKWQAKADELRRLGFTIQVSNALEQLVTDDERQAGLDLADVLLREWPGYPPSWDDKEGD